jgi:hypothetical protein
MRSNSGSREPPRRLPDPTRTQTLKLALKPEIPLLLQVFGRIKQKHEIDGRRR